MASATHRVPTSPLSVIVPKPRRGICTPLLSVTLGITFAGVLVSDMASASAPPRPRNMAEAANWALVCKKSRRFIPLELRSMFMVVEINELLGSGGFTGDFLPVPPVCKRFFPNRPSFYPARLFPRLKAAFGLGLSDLILTVLTFCYS